MPTTIGASRRAASAATSVRSRLVENVGDVDDVLRPDHQVDRALERPGGVQVAFEHDAGVGVDGVRALRAAALDEGDAGGVHLVPAGRHGGEEHEGGDTADQHAAGANRRRDRADSATPPATTTIVSRRMPPMRASGASGPSAWPMAREASGTPSNGKRKRSASASVMAAGRPSQRHRPAGVTAQATPR